MISASRRTLELCCDRTGTQEIAGGRNCRQVLTAGKKWRIYTYREWLEGSGHGLINGGYWNRQ